MADVFRALDDETRHLILDDLAADTVPTSSATDASAETTGACNSPSTAATRPCAD